MKRIMQRGFFGAIAIFGLVSCVHALFTQTDVLVNDSKYGFLPLCYIVSGMLIAIGILVILVVTRKRKSTPQNPTN